MVRTSLQYERAGFMTLTFLLIRDVAALQPYLTSYVKAIPWIKLYKREDQSFGQFIADVAFNIDVLAGQAKFLLPDVNFGLYFLAGMCSLS